GEEFEAAQRVADFMRQESRHLDQRLLLPKMLAIVFQLLRLADVAQNENRSGMGLALLQPGVAEGKPGGVVRIRRRLVVQRRLIRRRFARRTFARRTGTWIGERQLGLFSTLASALECGPERGGQRVGRFESAANEARRLGVESRNPSSGFDYQDATGQAFQYAAQAFADAVVFLETSGQVAIGDFQFLPEMRHLPLQLPIGTLKRTRRFRERGKGAGERMFGISH